MGILKIGHQLSENGSPFGHSFEAPSVDDIGREEENISRESSGDDCGDCDAEVGCELCMFQGQQFNVPYELYDLPDLKDILSLETWNYWLTEEERFSLSAYLPDMDQQTFWLTMKQLLGGKDMFFESPLTVFFRDLKGGDYHQKVTCYKGGHKFLQWVESSHSLRAYHENMIRTFSDMKRLWDPCGLSIGVHERIRIWKVRKSQKLGMSSLDLNAYPEDESNNEINTKLNTFPSSKKMNLLDWKNGNPITLHPPISTKMMLVPTSAKGVLKVKPTGLNAFQAFTPKPGPIEDWALHQSPSKGILKIVSKGLVNQQEQSRTMRMQSESSPLIEIPVSKTSTFSSLPSPMHRWDAKQYDEFIFPSHKLGLAETVRRPDLRNHIMYQKMVECKIDAARPFENSDNCMRNVKGPVKSHAPITSPQGHSLLGGNSKCYREQKITSPQEKQVVPKLNFSHAVLGKFIPHADQVNSQQDSDSGASLHKLCAKSGLSKGVSDGLVFPKTYKRRKVTKDRKLEFAEPITVETDLKFRELWDGNDPGGNTKTLKVRFKDFGNKTLQNEGRLNTKPNGSLSAAYNEKNEKQMEFD